MNKSKSDSLQRLLVVPDCHFPHHDKRAWNLLLKVGREWKPDIIVTLGDFADFYSVSAHDKDPRRASFLDKEVASAKAGLKQLKGLGAKRNIFIAGNHENRLERYLMTKAPELFETVTIPGVLGLKESGWEYVPYKEDVKIGKLYLTHDIGKAGRSANYDALNAYQHCVVLGHVHRLSYAVEGNAAGEAKVGATFGWLGDRKAADYMHKIRAARDWALGFGTGRLLPSGEVFLAPHPIVGYKVCVEGKLYVG